MKRTILSLLVILFSVYQSYTQTNCDCWENEFKGKDLSYRAAVDKMETAFIDKGYLNGKKPADYIELMDSIIAKNEYYLFRVVFNPTLVQNFESCFLLNSCEQATYRNIRKMNNQLVNYSDISPRQTFTDFKKTFEKKNFRKTEVKHYFLTFYLANLSKSLPSLKPKVASTSATLVWPNTLKVHLSHNDSIYINDQHIEFEGLKVLALNHLSNSGNSPETELIEIEGLGKRNVSGQAFLLSAINSTPMKLIIKVQEHLLAAYTEARNQIGLKEFGISYEQMLKNRDKHEQEIKIIERLMPEIIRFAM